VGDHEEEIYRQIRDADWKPMLLVLRVPREEDLQSIL
jgi:hypothetical protein